jgi:hypothetical protein
MSIQDIRKRAAEARSQQQAAEDAATQANVDLVTERAANALQNIANAIAEEYSDIGRPKVGPIKARAMYPGALSHLMIEYRLDDLEISIESTLAWDEDAPEHSRTLGVSSGDVNIKARKLPHYLLAEVAVERIINVTTGGFTANAAARFLRGLEEAIGKADAAR